MTWDKSKKSAEQSASIVALDALEIPYMYVRIGNTRIRAMRFVAGIFCFKLSLFFVIGLLTVCRPLSTQEA